MKKIEQPKEKKWLYHPGLVIPERGMTGNYLPVGVDSDGIPLIELETLTPTREKDNNP